MKATFMIYGWPQPKQGKRFSPAGREFTPQATREYEELVGREYNRQTNRTWFGVRAVSVTVRVEYTTPASSGPERRRAMMRGWLRPISRRYGDLDNVTKCVLDGLNGVAWVDDSQVVGLQAEKRYSQREAVVVTISDAMQRGTEK